VTDQTVAVHKKQTLPTRRPAFRFILNLKTVHQAHGSHRPGRARMRASGSSTNSFAIHVVPEAIRSIDVDMWKNLDVFNMFPSIDSAGRRFAFLHCVLRGEFPSFNGTIKALGHPTAVSPHFVSFA